MTSPSPTPSLAPLPAGFARTRDALHQLAFFVLSPHRMDHEQRMGLRPTPAGFGTPWFDTPDGRRRVRMRRDELVVETGDDERSHRPATVRDACAALDMPYREVWFDDFHDPLGPRDPDAPLVIDPGAVEALAAWFAVGWRVLEEVAATAGAEDPSQVQLWPEHFDPAVELGAADAGRRASYGASPGDDAHPEPYLYVAPWGEHTGGTYWNDDAFGGASLAHAELLAAEDPIAHGVGFLRRGHDLLTT